MITVPLLLLQMLFYGAIARFIKGGIESFFGVTSGQAWLVVGSVFAVLAFFVFGIVSAFSGSQRKTLYELGPAFLVFGLSPIVSWVILEGFYKLWHVLG